MVQTRSESVDEDIEPEGEGSTRTKRTGKGRAVFFTPFRTRTTMLRGTGFERRTSMARVGSAYMARLPLTYAALQSIPMTPLDGAGSNGRRAPIRVRRSVLSASRG